MIIVFSILGAVIVALSAVLTAAAIIGRPLKVNPSRKLDGVNDDIQNALWYSSIAANSHNTQMWSVKLYPNENRLQISIDESRVLNVVDSEKREAYISLGCYIETMSVAFGAYGYDTQVNCADLAVNVTYQKSANTTVDTAKLSLIDKQETVNALLNKYSALSVYQNGDENFDYIKRISMDAVTVQSANQAYRDELAEWMCFSDKEAASKLDGITAEMIGLKGIVKTFYYWTTTRESAKGDKFAQQGINTAKKQLNNCGAFAVITGGNTFEELINTGRKAQAFWFDCAANNIAVQPFPPHWKHNHFVRLYKPI